MDLVFFAVSEAGILGLLRLFRWLQIPKRDGFSSIVASTFLYTPNTKSSSSALVSNILSQAIPSYKTPPIWPSKDCRPTPSQAVDR